MARGIDVNQNTGNIYITGFIQYDVTFGLGELNEVTLTSTSDNDIFLAKYTPNGSFEWAKQVIGDGTFDTGLSLSVDQTEESIVLTGAFLSVATFGLGELNETSLTSVGEDDIFIAKYNQNGTLQWSKRSGGLGRDSGNDVIVNETDGTIALVGNYEYSAIFGEGEPNETTLTADGIKDVFIAQYDQFGNLNWAKQTHDATQPYGHSIDINVSNGEIIIVGDFGPTITFGLNEPNETILNSYSGDDIFIACYNSDGSFAWGDCDGGTGRDIGEGISINQNTGNISVTGLIYGESYFDYGEPTEAVVNIGRSDYFHAQYNGSILNWVKDSIQASQKTSLSIAVNSLTGEAVITGFFDGTCVFGPDELNETLLTSTDVEDGFIACLLQDGSLSWVKQIIGDRFESLRDLSISPNDGSIAGAGGFDQTATFGFGEPNETTLSISGGYNNVVICRYNPNGSLQWARQDGGDNDDFAFGVAITPSDDSIVATGYFKGTSIFGEGEPQETTLVANGYYYDIFLAKYSYDGLLIWAKKAGSSINDLATAVAVSDFDDTIFLTGYFGSTALFGQGEPNETSLVSTGYQDAFYARYNSDGTLIWARQSGGIFPDISSDIEVNPIDNSFAVIGYYQDTTTLGQGEPNETVLISAGDEDIFIAQYNQDGSLIWARSAGSSSSDDERGLGVDVNPADGSILATGYFRETAIFGPGEMNEMMITAFNNGKDIFVLNYSSAGYLQWVTHAGPASGDFYDICFSQIDNSAIITGPMGYRVIFGYNEYNEMFFYAPPDDSFVAKFAN